MFHIRSNIEEQKSNIAVLTEIVKNMEVPEGILTHVLETHKDNYDKNYHYDVCEFLAEAIEVSDKERFGLLNMGKTTMGNTFFLKIGVYEGIIMAKLGYSGRFNNQKDAETAKKCSSSIISLCKEQSRLISEKENDIVFDSFFKVYLNLSENKKKSIKEEYKNNPDLLRSHANQIKDHCDYLAKKHEFILDNFSYLNEILVRYFERRESAENLIDRLNHQNHTTPSDSENRGLNDILDGIKLLDIYSKKGENINSKKVQETIKNIHQNYEFITIDTKGIEQEIKKLFKDYTI